MKRHWITRLLVLSGLLLSCAVSADPGALVSVAATGGATNYDINVYLNALAPATGQRFHISSGTTLAITPLVPKGGSHCYNMGIEPTTPGFRVTSGAVGQVNGISQLPLTCTGQSAAVVINGGEALACKGADGKCRVFLSNALPKGDMTTTPPTNCGTASTGVARANCICGSDTARPADNGQYAAWLSTTTTPALDNIQYDPSKTYVRAGDGAVIARPPNSEFPRTLLNSISPPAPPGYAWTGTSYAGSIGNPPENCDNWEDSTGGPMAQVGLTNTGSESWTALAIGVCSSTSNRIYCFEVPSS